MSLPNRVDPRKYAVQGVLVEEEVVPHLLPRLSQAVVEVMPSVKCYLQFGVDEEGFRLVSGTVSAQVMVTCERCMGSLEQQLQGEFHLAIVGDDERAKDLPKRFEAWVVGSEPVDLHELVEEELLLCLPPFSYHNEDQCQVKTQYSPAGIDVEKEADAAGNPFSVLQQLLDDPASKSGDE